MKFTGKAKEIQEALGLNQKDMEFLANYGYLDALTMFDGDFSQRLKEQFMEMEGMEAEIDGPLYESKDIPTYNSILRKI